MAGLGVVLGVMLVPSRRFTGVVLVPSVCYSGTFRVLCWYRARAV